MFKYIVLLTLVGIAQANGVHIPGWWYGVFIAAIIYHLLTPIFLVAMKTVLDKENK